MSRKSAGKGFDLNELTGLGWDWCKNWGRRCELGIFSLFSDRWWGVGWIVRLVDAGAEGPGVEIMEISKPDDLGNIANLGLTLAEAKQLLAGFSGRSPARRRRGTRSGALFAPAPMGFAR